MAESPYDSAINDLVDKINEAMQPIFEDQRVVNALCAKAGRPLLYPEVDTPRAGGSRQIKRDQFHGKPLATAVKQYLELRGPSDRGGAGAATVNEIFDALVAGGYKPETSDREHAKRGLRIALTKNSYLFYRVSTDATEGGHTYGLLEWYPNAKPQKPDDDAPPKGKRGRPAKAAKKQKRAGRPPGPPKAKPKPASADDAGEPENIVDFDKMKAATDTKPVAADELRKPRAAASQAKRGSETPERKEEPHVDHEPDVGSPVTGPRAA